MSDGCLTATGIHSQCIGLQAGGEANLVMVTRSVTDAVMRSRRAQASIHGRRGASGTLIRRSRATPAPCPARPGCSTPAGSRRYRPFICSLWWRVTLVRTITACSFGTPSGCTRTRPTHGAGQGVRVRPRRVQRCRARPRGRPQGGRSLSHGGCAVPEADHPGQADTRAVLAGRGLRSGAPAVPARRGERLQELLRLPQGPAPGREERCAPLQVPQGHPSVDPLHRQCPLVGHRQRAAEPAEGWRGEGEVVPQPARAALLGHRGQGRGADGTSPRSSSTPTRTPTPTGCPTATTRSVSIWA